MGQSMAICFATYESAWKLSRQVCNGAQGKIIAMAVALVGSQCGSNSVGKGVVVRCCCVAGA